MANLYPLTAKSAKPVSCLSSARRGRIRYRELTHYQSFELLLGWLPTSDDVRRHKATAAYFPGCSQFGHAPECRKCPSYFESEADRHRAWLANKDEMVLNPGARPFGWWLYEYAGDRTPPKTVPEDDEDASLVKLAEAGELTKEEIAGLLAVEGLGETYGRRAEKVRRALR